MALLTPQFIDTISKFNYNIDYLKSYAEDIENSSVEELFTKQKMLTDVNKTVNYTVALEFRIYYKFRLKCQQEGYSFIEGLNMLLSNYVDGKLILKEE